MRIRNTGFTETFLVQVVADPRTKEDKLLKGGEDKKENDVPTMADLFSAHDFDIKIDLSTGTPNTALKLNLTPVGSVKPDNGPKKSLNLADYKKKRGLI
jgi:RNA polymerase-associated protein RTF1